MDRKARLRLGNRRTYLLLGVIIVVALGVFAQSALGQESEEAPQPSEVVEFSQQGYKFANNSGILLFAKELEHCEIKPDGENDGYKICRPEIGIWNQRNEAVSFDLSSNNFEFTLSQDSTDEFNYEFADEYNWKGELPSDQAEGEFNGELANADEWSNSGEEISLEPGERIAVRVEFEIPQYESDFYELVYTPLGLIFDPNISACGTLVSAGATYTLTDDIVVRGGNCLVVNADNITIDGDGYTLDGNESSGHGIKADGYTGLVVKNIDITNFNSESISIDGVSSNYGGGSLMIYDSIVESITSSGYSNVTGCTVGGNGGQVYLFDSDVSDSIFVNGGDGDFDFECVGEHPEGGEGGTISFENEIIVLSGVDIEMDDGTDSNGFSNSELSLNYTLWDDSGATYSGVDVLTIINSDGIIEWSSITGSISDLENNIEISNNYAFANGTAVSGLDSSAYVSLYGLPGNFTNPGILRDGVPCVGCVNYTSLNDVDVEFSVPGFSAYSVGEDNMAGESQGDSAIEEAIANIIANSSITSDQQIYLVDSSGNHSLGTYDKVAYLGTQTWAFNYVTGGESFVSMNSLFDVLNIWQNQTLSSGDIVSQVELFINGTLV